MKIHKPKFWNSKASIFVYILYPFSLLIRAYTYLKRIFDVPHQFKIKVICVGNIYIGGTGKTPLAIYLAKGLQKIGKKTAIIKKNYVSQIDEQKLIRSNFENLITDSLRSKAIKSAEKKGFDLAILDDGFQDFKINKNLNILCFNQHQKIGNGLIIPSGPLRESLNSISDAKIAIINGIKDIEFEKLIYSYNQGISIYYSRYMPSNIKFFENKKLLAFAGIGNPENFFNLLLSFNLDVRKKLSFPDHYKFNNNELTEIINEAKKNNYQIITTEKDYFRIKNFNNYEIEYLKVELSIERGEELIDNIKKYI